MPAPSSAGFQRVRSSDSGASSASAPYPNLFSDVVEGSDPFAFLDRSEAPSGASDPTRHWFGVSSDDLEAPSPRQARRNNKHGDPSPATPRTPLLADGDNKRTRVYSAAGSTRSDVSAHERDDDGDAVAPPSCLSSPLEYLDYLFEKYSIQFRDPRLEASYLRYTARSRLKDVQRAWFFTALVCLAFFVLDVVKYWDDDKRSQFWTVIGIRLALVVWMLLVGAIWRRHPGHLVRHYEPATGACVLVALITLMVLGLFSYDRDIGIQSIVPITMVFMTFSSSTARHRSSTALFMNIGALIAFNIIFSLSPATSYEIYSGDAFIFFGIAIYLLGSFSIERYCRSEFLLRRALNRDKARTEAILRQTVPDAVTDELKKGRQVARRATASVCFVAIHDFRDMLARRSPEEALRLIDLIYRNFDDLVARSEGVMKVETVLDTYVTVAGGPLETASDDHVAKIANFALSLLEVVRVFSADVPLQIRCGIHTGPVVAGVVGTSRLFYRLFGDTVNVSSRLCSKAAPGEIVVSKETNALLREGKRQYGLRPKGTFAIKGKGDMELFVLKSQRKLRAVTVSGGSARRPAFLRPEPAKTTSVSMRVASPEPDSEDSSDQSTPTSSTSLLAPPTPTRGHSHSISGKRDRVRLGLVDRPRTPPAPAQAQGGAAPPAVPKLAIPGADDPVVLGVPPRASTSSPRSLLDKDSPRPGASAAGSDLLRRGAPLSAIPPRLLVEARGAPPPLNSGGDGSVARSTSMSSRESTPEPAAIAVAKALLGQRETRTVSPDIFESTSSGPAEPRSLREWHYFWNRDVDLEVAPPMHARWLTFHNKDLERRFRSDYMEAMRVKARVIAILACLAHFVFAVGDVVGQGVYQDDLVATASLRLLNFLAFFFYVVALARPQFADVFQPVTYTVFVIAGASVAGLQLIANEVSIPACTLFLLFSIHGAKLLYPWAVALYLTSVCFFVPLCFLPDRTLKTVFWRMSVLLVAYFTGFLTSRFNEARIRLGYYLLQCVNHERVVMESMLDDLLPAPVVAGLKAGRRMVASVHENVNLMQLDLVDFTMLSSSMPPEQVFSLLNSLFVRFDAQLKGSSRLSKLETVGDSYVIVSNLFDPSAASEEQQVHNACQLVELACTFQMIMEEMGFVLASGKKLQARIGLVGGGTVVAGTAGRTVPRFHVWGDPAWEVSAVESRCPPGCVAVNAHIYELTKAHFAYDGVPLDNGVRVLRAIWEGRRWRSGSVDVD